MQKHNTMAVPASAKALVKVLTVEELIEALAYADQQGLQVLILGEGSNTVFVNDYDGLIVLNRIKGVDVLQESTDSIQISVSAGENWHQLVESCVLKGWYGLENLALIPGLAGAAPIQNIGAYGAELKDYIISVTCIELSSGKKRILDREQCQFSYRDSIFKNKLVNKVVITSLILKLSKTPNVNLSYPALADVFEGDISPSPVDVYNAVCELRSSKLPQPSQIPNCGSFFKNPLIDVTHYQELLKIFPNLPAFAVADKYKLPAAWLIEQAGWKDRMIDGVSVHQKQALVIINVHGASGAAILNFANAIQNDIAAKYGVRLEIEPQLV